MVYIKYVTMKSSFQIPLWFTMLVIISLMFCAPNVISGAEKYYYLHISSFRLEERAVKDVEALRNHGYDAVTRREHVHNKGYWYRVYIGPFSSLQEAKSKRDKVISRKFSDYVAIKKTEYLIKSDIGKPSEEEEKKVVLEPKKEIPKVSPPEELTPPSIKEPGEIPPTPEKPSEEKEVIKIKPPQEVTLAEPEEPIEVPSTPEKPPLAKEVPAPIPSMEEHGVVKAPTPVEPKRPPERINAKPPSKIVEMAPKGRGRNIGRGNFGLGLRHTYRELPLELTKRTRITSDGTTTTIEDVSITNREEEDYITSLHMDSLRIRLGLTNYLEIFAEIDGPYQELSDLGFAYGGGLRLNLFQTKGGWLRGFYSAIQGEYLSGEVEYEYSSSIGDKWKKKVDWEEFMAKGELGLAGTRFNAYIGATYFDYREDAERELLENLPLAFTSFVWQDELEEKESVGAFGGITINLSSAFLINIEGQVITQESVFMTLEYYF